MRQVVYTETDWIRPSIRDVKVKQFFVDVNVGKKDEVRYLYDLVVSRLEEVECGLEKVYAEKRVVALSSLRGFIRDQEGVDDFELVRS
jgi:hypothetical protein